MMNCFIRHIIFQRCNRRVKKHFKNHCRKKITIKMLNLITTLIFLNFLRAIFTAQPTIVLNSSVETEEQAAQYLVEIKPNEVLPLVLFTKKKRTFTMEAHQLQLVIPQEMYKAETLDGKMVQGTEFFTEDALNQMLFCPKQNSQDKCLVPQTFKESEQLQCAEEPISVVQEEIMGDSCGPRNNSIPYNIVYEICPNEEEYVTKKIEMYAICYNPSKRKTVHTLHIISSPYLLQSNLLFRERKVPYPFIENDKFKLSTFEKIKFAPHEDLNLLTHPEKPDYKIQKLVPDTDMAFALWRKSTFQNFNLDWQHKTLIPLWNKINDFVKYKAIHMKEFEIELHVQTAVFDIIPSIEDDATISNIWIKLVTTMPSNPAMAIQGIAILMNNFITSATDDSITLPYSTDQAITKFCSRSICFGSLLKEFEKVKGRVHCCPVNRDIAKVFDWRNITQDMTVLNVPGINSEFKRAS